MITFENVKLGALFFKGGTLWRKKSTRTAYLANSIASNGWFYFSKEERVILHVTQSADHDKLYNMIYTSCIH